MDLKLWRKLLICEDRELEQGWGNCGPNIAS